MGRAARVGVAIIAVLALVAVLGIVMRTGIGPLPDPQRCEASAGGRSVELSTEQAENAALIAAVGVRRGLPARAVSIALATAYQESKIVNLDHGDRDSLGLFQQRPSQGWGTPEQIQDPLYSINAFYDALAEVEDYQRMRITVAAQEVQRSGFPEAYADHADDARTLASALTGWSTGGAFSCVVGQGELSEQTRLDAAGLTGRAARLRRDLDRAFGDLSLGGFAPGGVSSGHMEGSAHYEGRALDIFVRPVDRDNRRLGWAIAAYLVAQAEKLHVDHVIFDGRIWSAGVRSEQGWRDYDPGSTRGKSAETIAILEHRDHVHVDVP